jgi:hypothetical protein
VTSQIMFGKDFIQDDYDADAHFLLVGAAGTHAFPLIQKVGHEVRLTQQDGDGIDQDNLPYVRLQCSVVDQPGNGTGAKGMTDDTDISCRPQMAIDGLPHAQGHILFVRRIGKLMPKEIPGFSKKRRGRPSRPKKKSMGKYRAKPPGATP